MARVVNNTETIEYDEITEVCISSTKYGFIARKGNKYVVVINGQKIGTYTKARGLVFSLRSYMVLVTKNGKQVCIKNGKEYPMLTCVK
jgi:hypothetical protein